MVTKKPDNRVFASTAPSAEVEQFPDIERGWGITFEQTNGIPPMEWFNFLQKRTDERIAYLLEHGIAEWQEAITYPQNALVQHDGKVYKAITETLGHNPLSNLNTKWTEWGLDTAVLNDYVAKTAKSNSVSSTSTDTVATSSAVKKAYDKAVEAYNRTPSNATTSQVGIVQLSNSTDSDDETKAATPKAVKAAYDRAVEAEGRGLPLGAIVAFPKEITSPQGFLKCDGTTFNQATFPDLYRALGNSNQLPNLNGEIGQLAYFPFDQAPNGWLAFDDIRTQVNSTDYPALYQLLINQYGSLEHVPLSEDRFIRGLGGGLTIGQTQADEIKQHKHKFPLAYAPSTAEFKYDITTVGYQKGATYRTDSWSTSRDEGPLMTLWKDHNAYDGSNGFGYFYNDDTAEGGEENRPKAIAFKLFIKAKNELIFWIKAYGQVVNGGELDASTLAQHLQEKADRSELANKINREELTALQSQLTTQIQESTRQNAHAEEVIWSGNAAENTPLRLSKSPTGKYLIIDLMEASSRSLSNATQELRHIVVYIPDVLTGREAAWGKIVLSLNGGTYPISQRGDAYRTYYDVTLNQYVEIHYTHTDRQIKLLGLQRWIIKQVRALLF